MITRQLKQGGIRTPNGPICISFAQVSKKTFGLIFLNLDLLRHRMDDWSLQHIQVMVTSPSLSLLLHKY